LDNSELKLKYGKLTPLGKTNNKNSSGSYLWEFLCDCGNKTYATLNSVKIGHKLSCGCLHRETNKKYNTYIFYENYICGYTFKNEEFKIDVDDYERVKEFCWRKDSKGYFVADSNNIKSDSRVLKLHRFVMDCQKSDNKIVDHINFDKGDNRKINLRFVSSIESSIWQKTRKTNTSGFIGVSNQDGKWVAYIDSNSERIHLGTFSDKNDAVITRLKAEIKYFGEFAPQRYLYDAYLKGDI
jgi:hypothetical protein